MRKHSTVCIVEAKQKINALKEDAKTTNKTWSHYMMQLFAVFQTNGKCSQTSANVTRVMAFV